jgi:hypothetical protein
MKDRERLTKVKISPQKAGLPPLHFRKKGYSILIMSQGGNGNYYSGEWTRVHNSYGHPWYHFGFAYNAALKWLNWYGGNQNFEMKVCVVNRDDDILWSSWEHGKEL